MASYQWDVAITVPIGDSQRAHFGEALQALGFSFDDSQSSEHVLVLTGVYNFNWQDDPDWLARSLVERIYGRTGHDYDVSITAHMTPVVPLRRNHELAMPLYHVYVLSFRDDADDDPYVWLMSSWVELTDEQVIRCWARDPNHDWAGDTPEERYATVVQRLPTIVATIPCY
jgi:hypothetical protein